MSFSTHVVAWGSVAVAAGGVGGKEIINVVLGQVALRLKLVLDAVNPICEFFNVAREELVGERDRPCRFRDKLLTPCSDLASGAPD